MSLSIVTGAASGIGRAVALQQARLGLTVFALDIDLSGLQETKRLAEGDIKIIACDV